MTKLRILSILTFFLLITPSLISQTRSHELTGLIRESKSNYVFVVAHRGDWRHAPENSLQAIRNCMEMGVDMVEIDVRLTNDSVFVLMHDDTIDRTTNGTGRVSEMTWAQLSKLYLKDGIGALTQHKIPTLEQALEVARGRILLNLDKAYDYMPSLTLYLQEKGLLHQIVFKGWMTQRDQFQSDLSYNPDSILFMPIVTLDEPNWKEVIQSYDSVNAPIAFEILFKEEGLESEAIDLISNLNSRVWINSLWPHFNGGHDDERAVYDLEGSYGWLISKGVSIIQTDRPELLIEYLKSKGLR